MPNSWVAINWSLAGSTNNATLMSELEKFLRIFFKLSKFLITSKPPSVVISWRRSGTKQIDFGL